MQICQYKMFKQQNRTVVYFNLKTNTKVLSRIQNPKVFVKIRDSVFSTLQSFIKLHPNPCSQHTTECLLKGK